ncbi:helicase associated domain-containing protein [Kitasatospora sp. LaBMicrA B282]|uniref:helicase associated domain-containing protein n=1 Tax=Kitasatospora sp. LaBMicrA B282 TaxID=3420949 RepID=UPI003D0B9B80
MRPVRLQKPSGAHVAGPRRPAPRPPRPTLAREILGTSRFGLYVRRANGAPSRTDRFQLGLAAFAEREGHVRVPRTHREEGLSLGTWLNNTRARQPGLTAEQRGQLEALGVAW